MGSAQDLNGSVERSSWRVSYTLVMPVIVVGADTSLGEAIIHGLSTREGEVRAFVTDPDVAERLKRRGVKVATGDVSDASHVEGACTNVHTAVLITEAAVDGRERSFAKNRDAVLQGWADAVAAAAVTRVLWVDDGDPLRTAAIEEAVIDATLDQSEVVSRVVELDEAGSIPSR